MERPEGGSEGRSIAAGKRFSSKILLCPAERLFTSSYVVRVSRAVSGISNKPVTDHESTRTAGYCARPEMMGESEDKGRGRALCKDLIVQIHL